MRSIFYFVPIFASHAFSMESMNSGQPNVLDERQSTDYCGIDVYGNDLFCINSLCCENGVTGIWSCYGSDDQCCATGYTCPSGGQCYLDSSGDQLCLQGGSTVTGSTGNTPQTSASSPTQTKGTAATQTAAPAATPKSDGAGELDRVANNLAKMLGLTGAAALFLV